MIASEKKSGKSHYKKGKAYSPILAEAADDMIDCRKELRKESVSTPRDEDKMEELKILLKEAKREFRIIQSKSHELREKFLQELYTKKAKAWNITSQQAATVICEAEASRKMHKRHKDYIKPQQQGATKYILVPAPVSNWTPKGSDITNKNVQTRVDDPKQIFNILLRQNFRQLLKSEKAISNHGEYLEKIGWNAEKDFVQNLLQGNRTETILSNTKADKITENFIQAMRYAINKDGDQISTFRWEYGIKEYQATFSKTRESTACGPSGLHMSHWKATLEREAIMRIHSFFIWAAFQFGYSYDR